MPRLLRKCKLGLGGVAQGSVHDEHCRGGPGDEPRGNGRVQKLLVITDDSAFLADLQTAVPRATRMLIEAPKSRDALRQLERETPDLVILCMDLAGGDAFELLLSIRGMGSCPPVIAMAALSRPQYELRLGAALHVGAAMALPRPVAPDILFEAIDRLIGPAS